MEEETQQNAGQGIREDRPVGERGSILIISRNSLHLTKKAVASALAQDIPCDVLVIDNASSDGTVQWLASKDTISRVCLSTQQSLSACWNHGLTAFWSMGRKHALVCNNDIELRSDAYRWLLEHGGSFVTCVGVNEREQVGVPGDREGRLWNERPNPDFSAFMIRKEVTDRVGWFNEEYYPAYAEDSEYHVRMHRAGIKAVCIDLPFLHHAASTLKNCDPAEAAVIRRGADANRARFKATYGCEVGSKEYYALFWQ